MARSGLRSGRSLSGDGAGAVGGASWAYHHLHSTATVFWVGEAEVGLIPVSEDPEEVDAVVLDTEDKTTNQRPDRKTTNQSPDRKTK